MKNRHKITELTALLTKASQQKVHTELWKLLFTPMELKQLAARYEIIKGLTLEEITQRELSASLKLSIAKITRGSNELKRSSTALRGYLLDFFTKRER